MLTMVSKVVEADLVPWISVESPGATIQIEIVVDLQCSRVKQNIMVRAQTENVPLYIWPVMRVPKGLDVGSLGVWPGRRFQSGTADLTFVLIERLHTCSHCGVPHNTLDCGRLPSWEWQRLS